MNAVSQYSIILGSLLLNKIYNLYIQKDQQVGKVVCRLSNDVPVNIKFIAKTQNHILCSDLREVDNSAGQVLVLQYAAFKESI